MKISRSLVNAFLIFPLNVMGVIPALLIWFSLPKAEFDLILYSFNSPSSLAGVLLMILGVWLCLKTVSLFSEVGEGTLSPFEPPRKLVTQWPYLNSRNPMMVGVWLVLLGEALVFSSIALGLWFVVFCSLCLVIIPVWEEPDLEKRFGDSYREYKCKTPRWIPNFYLIKR
jgi:protein-S-isoprenylcysteine O-methyltransferase Ste14